MIHVCLILQTAILVNNTAINKSFQTNFTYFNSFAVNLLGFWIENDNPAGHSSPAICLESLLNLF
uniref:Uncharacterized protein n=1 Tax=Arundo donax TaxID=35708 RepID=A0A0A9G6E4_ARUDO